MQQELKYYN